MAGTSPVLLILGAGANIGKHTAQLFASKGYKVAVTSRTAKEEKYADDQLTITADLAEPESVAGVFAKVKSALGAPSVVLYNAAAFTRAEDKNPFGVALSTFARDLDINTTSAYAAAQEAVAAFEQLPDSASRTFIYTGNCLNTQTVVPLLTLGVGKTATAHAIEIASKAYAERGYKFYYGDQRNADGSPMYTGLDGEAHAKLYLELAEDKAQRPWQQTFVKDKGYQAF